MRTPPAHEYLLRPATSADAEEVRALASRAYAPYIARIGRRPAPMDADYVMAIRRGQVDLLTDQDGAIAAFIVHFEKASAWFVENVAVEPARQGAGLGRRLLTHAEDRARGLGLSRLTLYTNAAMTENLAFYPRLGYAETDRRREDGFERVYFEKRLRGNPDAPDT